MLLEGENNQFDLEWTEWVLVLFCMRHADKIHKLGLSFDVPFTACGVESVLIADSLQGFLRKEWDLLAVSNGLREFPDGTLADTGTDPKQTKPACYIEREKFQKLLDWMYQCNGFVVEMDE